MSAVMLMVGGKVCARDVTGAVGHFPSWLLVVMHTCASCASVVKLRIPWTKAALRYRLPPPVPSPNRKVLLSLASPWLLIRMLLLSAAS